MELAPKTLERILSRFVPRIDETPTAPEIEGKKERP
jgi:hypothetical protein